MFWKREIRIQRQEWHGFYMRVTVVLCTLISIAQLSPKMASNMFLLSPGKSAFNMAERDFWFRFWNSTLMSLISIWKFREKWIIRVFRFTTTNVLILYKIFPFTDEVHTSDLEIIILIMLSSLVPIPPKEENNFST